MQVFCFVSFATVAIVLALEPDGEDKCYENSLSAMDKLKSGAWAVFFFGPSRVFIKAAQKLGAH